jgi:molybdate transport system ATP-binding protein
MSGLEADFTVTQPLALQIRLAVAPGELVALVGRSGAGKSTALKALAGLLPATGAIRVNDQPWLEGEVATPPHQRRLGYLFQAYALFPHLSALENLLLAQGAERDEARARQLLEAVQLDGLESRRPHQLSGGQQQRVALARALARNPQLLLLDEPFSATDRPTRRALAATLLTLRRELAMPILLVSHDIDDVAKLADRIAVLENGRIAQEGPTAEVIANPGSAGIAELVATSLA